VKKEAALLQAVILQLEDIWKVEVRIKDQLCSYVLQSL